MEQTNNRTDEIPCFTLEHLIAMHGASPELELSRGCLVAISNSQRRIFRYPCRIDALFIGVCTEGETEITFNLNTFRLTKNSMFVYTPKNIIQANSDDEFKAHMIAITPEFMRHINVDIKRMMPLFLRYANQPCIELAEEESQMLRGFIEQVGHELERPKTLFGADVVSGLVSATIYKVCDILYRHQSAQPVHEAPIRSRSEFYFKEFMRLLGENYKSERSVSFYAQKLCITPKYLTTLIKRVSGKSVSDWIDDYVILEAKTLLKSSNMSIQEIAYYLNFPNQSFFGCYFKRHAGLSPSQYKLQS